MADHGGGIGQAPRQAPRTTPRLGPYDTAVQVAHGLGIAVLMLSEYWRMRINHARVAEAPSDQPKSVLDAAVSLADEDWHRKAVDLFDAVSFGQERAALWAAVFFALVVRWNKEGPAQLQLALSYVTAAYCALATAVGLYYAASGWLVALALAFAAVVVRSATRE